MKFLILIAICISCVASFLIDPLLTIEWESFKAKHSKIYKTVEEEALRFDTWKSNLKFIAEHNAKADQGVHSFWVAMNKFGDLVGFVLKRF